ncbi:single-stranded-DNA-specific exonuclease RecJ [Thermorudis peleae]|uniref:single-stranded-DNA-specific exonuclease RecJ n=1 Tax=Thermorudis peleae TaxID=1382356 RepID=UPI00057072D2|nr:single-stranded-DNA-specific exonuclease RecJ [Thermorudis peleae]
MRYDRWLEPEPLPDETYRLTPFPLLSIVLYRRGVRTPQDAARFLDPRLEHLSDPLALPDAARAIAMLRRAIAQRWPVLVFGDYDVDGLTATAMLTLALRRAGVPVQVRIPNRLTDGYGLRPDDLEPIRRSGARLLIAVDCGSSSADELAALVEAGIACVVIDHHVVPAPWPLSAVPLVSPKRPEAPCPGCELTAAGLVAQLLRTIVEPELLPTLLVLAAFGTIADVAPLTGDNRVLARLGLDAFAEAAPLGLRRLATLADLDPARITSRQVGFVLAPRLNAAGRLTDPQLALDLLLTDDEAEATQLALRLCELNAERQRAVARMIEEAEARLQALPALPEVLVLADERWHVGLVGLLASRLVERYERPAIVLAQQNGVSRGSARSVPGFDVTHALAACRDLLHTFGGHSVAAGLTLPSHQVDALQARLVALARQLQPQRRPRPVRELVLDAELFPSELELRTLDLLERLEPCGQGNPAPRFLLRNVRPVEIRPSQDGRHVRFNVLVDGQPAAFPCIWFQGGSEQDVLAAPRVDLALTLRRDEWAGLVALTLEVLDVRPAS